MLGDLLTIGLGFMVWGEAISSQLDMISPGITN